MDDAIDNQAAGVSGAVGDHLGDDMQGILDSGGELFFDPRTQWGIDPRGSTPCCMDCIQILGYCEARCREERAFGTAPHVESV